MCLCQKLQSSEQTEPWEGWEAAKLQTHSENANSKVQNPAPTFEAQVPFVLGKLNYFVHGESVSFTGLREKPLSHQITLRKPQGRGEHK